MVIYPDSESYDDEDGLEFRKIQNKVHKKLDMKAVLNKRAVTSEEMDALFLGE